MCGVMVHASGCMFGRCYGAPFVKVFRTEYSEPRLTVGGQYRCGMWAWPVQLESRDD